MDFINQLGVHSVVIIAGFSCSCKYCASLLTDAFNSLLNTPLWTHSIRDCWKLVSNVTIPKPSKSTVAARCFRPIAVNLCVVLWHLNAVFGSDDPLQLAYKSNSSTMDAIASRVHNITKSLDASAKSVPCTFFDLSSAVDCVTQSFDLRKLEQFSCSKSL